MSGAKTELVLADTNSPTAMMTTQQDYFDISLHTYKTKMFPQKKSNSKAEYYFKRPRDNK